MLADKREIIFKGEAVKKTPLLIPSFSSKGFPDIGNIVSSMSAVITESTLISAYDLYYGSGKSKIQTPINFPELIFLDSGGYETTKDYDIAEHSNFHEGKPKEWTVKLYESVLDAWNSSATTVCISFDHPKYRIPLTGQIKEAQKLFENRNMIKEFLVKPETTSQKYINVEQVCKSSALLKSFDIIGFTEKELGNTILKRMANVAKIRKALLAHKINKPIHIFGSLDTVTTPLYFLAGADIFDGLSWLRFGFSEGHTHYQPSFGAIKFGIDTLDDQIRLQSITANIGLLIDLQLSMASFLNKDQEDRFDAFRFHKDFFKRSYEFMISKG